MQEKESTQSPSQSLSEETATYHFKGRTFIVQPVFKEESTNTLGAILLRLMQADCEKRITSHDPADKLWPGAV